MTRRGFPETVTHSRAQAEEWGDGVPQRTAAEFPVYMSA
jgi:hypothetical protein